MIKFIVKKTIKDYEKTADPVVRGRYVTLSGTLGIICNGILFAIKLSIGLIMGSIAIMSDAFNNLSDMGTSLVTIVNAKVSEKKPDGKHPFGYGRIEYISALIVSFIIIIVGFELLKSSVTKIFNPEPLNFNFILIGILTLSVLIKVYMYVYNNYISKTIESKLIRATATDSLTDCIATGTVIVATVIGNYVKFPVDGIIGTIVALIIMYSGFGIAKDIISSLLGKSPDPELVRKISEIILSGEGINGLHDLIVHDYGPGRVVASVHAEVSDKCDIVAVHDAIDDIEKRVNEELGITIVIHMDPISEDKTEEAEIRHMVAEIAKKENECLMIHDLRVENGENQINIIFDIVIPAGTKKQQENLWIENIKKKIREKDDKYVCVVNIDYGY